MATVSAQSGRNREKPPATTTTTQPARPPAAPEDKPAPTTGPSIVSRPIPREVRVERQDDEGATVRFVLRNGLTVIVYEQHATPIASVVSLVAAGTATEPRAGVAYATARMVQAAGPPKSTASERMKLLGGDVATEVGADVTTFSSTVPAEAVGKAVEIQIAALNLAPQEPDLLTVVQAAAELDNAMEQPLDLGRRRAFEAMSPGGPLAKSRGADAIGLKAITREDLLGFQRASYVPNKTVIAVAGDVSTFDVLETIQLAYAGKSPTPSTAPTPPASVSATPFKDASQTMVRYATDRADTGHVVVTVSYPAPPLTAHGSMIPRMIVALLAVGRASRIAAALRTQGVAIGVRGDYVATLGQGAYVFQLVADAKQIDAAEASFFREIDRFRRERVSAGELQRARNVIERRSIDFQAPSDRAALTIARGQALYGDFRAESRALGQLNAITPDAIQLAAASAFSATRATVHELLTPQVPQRSFTPEQFAATVSAWAPGVVRDVAQADVRLALDVPEVEEGKERNRQGILGGAVLAPLPVAVRDFSTLSGSKAFVREDQSRPTIAVGLFFGAGRLLEKPENAGITELMLRSVIRQTRGDETDLVAFVEQLGGEISIVNEPDFSGLVVEVLSRNADAAVDALVKMVEHPALEKEIIDRERDLMLAEMRDPRLRDTRSRELFWAGRLPPHPYGRTARGTEQSLSKLSIEAVHDWYAATLKVQYPLVGVVGDTDGSSLISRHVADGFERDDAIETVPVAVPIVASTNSDTTETRDSRTTRQTVGFTFEGGVTQGSDAIAVAAEYGALRAIRDITTRKLPAAVMTFEVDQRRLISAVLATVESTAGAEGSVREVVVSSLSTMGANNATPEDLAIARASLTVREQTAWQGHSSRLIEYVRAVYCGAPVGWVDTRPARLASVTSEAVRNVASAIFSSTRAARGVVRGR